MKKNTIDNLDDKVAFFKKIEASEKEIEIGEGIDWEDMKKEMEQLLKDN